MVPQQCEGTQNHCTIHLNKVKMTNFYVVCISHNNNIKVQKYYAVITWAPTTNFRKKKTIFNLTSYESPPGIHCSPNSFTVHPCPDLKFSFIVPLCCFSALHSKGLINGISSVCFSETAFLFNLQFQIHSSCFMLLYFLYFHGQITFHPMNIPPSTCSFME